MAPTSSPATPDPGHASPRGRVLVAVGGSHPGPAARWAAREAARGGGTVHLLQVAATALAREQGRAALRTAAAACRDEAGDRVTVEAEQVVGDPAEVLVAAAPAARLVVTGRRDSTSWHSTSSVSAALADLTDVAMCVVPPSWSAPRRSLVAVGLDPERPDRAAVTEAVRRARLARAVLRVLVNRPGSLAPDPAEGLDELRRRAHEVVTECGGDACDVEVSVVEGHPASGLLAAARSADLLVLGRREHRGGPATYLGPVARAVLPWAECPVVLSRPEHEREPGPTRVPAGEDLGP